MTVVHVDFRSRSVAAEPLDYSIDYKTGVVASSALEVDRALLDRLRRLIDAEVEACDELWLEGDFDGYRDCAGEPDEILKAFRDNYSSRTIGHVRFDDLDAEAICSAVPADILLRAINEHSTLEASQDFYTEHNEMGSVSIGETEHQIDVDAYCNPDIYAAIESMSAADRKAFKKSSGIDIDRDSLCVYGRPCERLILKLDAEAFLKDKAIKASLKRTYPKAKAARKAKA